MCPSSLEFIVNCVWQFVFRFDESSPHVACRKCVEDDEENHPLEHHLIMESLEKGKVFGFPSKEAAEVWFSEEEFRIMAVMGFHLKEMKGKFPVYSNFEYEEGKSRQLVFMPDYSNENK
jgi:hypothetical protein